MVFRDINTYVSGLDLNTKLEIDIVDFSSLVT